MASDQLRKKWGTIFMGEREASPQQLDAMQEPLLRERAQQQHQEDYLARVRARAEERAREILGAAYAERQKVLEEAGAEAQTRILQLTREAQALRAQAQEELVQAQAEHGKARDLREEAEIIRDHAHNDGFQAGMAPGGPFGEHHVGLNRVALLYGIHPRQTLCQTGGHGIGVGGVA